MIRSMSSADDVQEVTTDDSSAFEFPINIMLYSCITMGFSALTGMYLIFMYFSAI